MRYLIIYCSLFIVFSGCSRQERPADLPPLYPLTLSFTQEGKPLTGATVLLVPEEENGKWFAGGITDTTGKTALKTQGTYSGIAAGKYKITVSKIEMDESSVVKSETRIPSPPVSYHRIVPKYADISTTPLAVEFKKGTVLPPFELGKEVRQKIIHTGP